MVEVEPGGMHGAKIHLDYLKCKLYTKEVTPDLSPNTR